MDMTTLENWLWDAACSMRGPLDAPRYKDYLLPLLFYKRLSDVYEDELRKLSREFGDEALARQLAEEDRALIRFYLPNGHVWPEVHKSPVRLGVDVHDLAPGGAQRPLQLSGQEINHVTYAMCKMNAFVHDMEAEIALGDTMKAPRFQRLRRAGSPWRLPGSGTGLWRGGDAEIVRSRDVREASPARR
jgi:type I restriction-modification system DNA methylase subunit